ncbi:unnamed protein product [Miscanthus lutarioriparius]|uniref:Uncharacterized protein n=1 Tax=Miscanthus lutarioriparius TaxID=422564 RepID=A0A811MV73_9POAL|nr:unnamed protein product [Miscanthus lutarioriparius]
MKRRGGRVPASLSMRGPHPLRQLPRSASPSATASLDGAGPVLSSDEEEGRQWRRREGGRGWRRGSGRALDLGKGSDDGGCRTPAGRGEDERAAGGDGDGQLGAGRGGGDERGGGGGPVETGEWRQALRSGRKGMRASQRREQGTWEWQWPVE